MKNIAIFILSLWLYSCKDDCTKTVTQRNIKSVQLLVDQLPQAKSGQIQELTNPTKIYVKDNLLFIGEAKKGIHIIDNSNPASPTKLGFIELVGNSDMAIIGNIMYVDSFTDLVVLDITNPQKISEINRIKNQYSNGIIDGLTWGSYIKNGVATIYDTDYTYTKTTQKVNCEGSEFYYPYPDCPNCFGEVSLGGAKSPGANSGASGTGGSMARFTIAQNFLYSVTQNEMLLFDINKPENPLPGSKINLGFGIETIFPYKTELYIGTTTGLQIFNNKNPQKPSFLSRVPHARACDPVVVENDFAYVTLRTEGSFNSCGVAFANQLDVIDVSTPSTPILKKEYPMQSPYGLGIDNGRLFVCEGKNGLKRFDAQNPLDLKQISHETGIDAYDVIPLKNTLMLIGKDGLYQYDYSNPNKMVLKSTIPVKVINYLN